MTLLLFAAAAAAAAAIAWALTNDGGGGGAQPTTRAGGGGAPQLKGAAAYDPFGDGNEHDRDVRLATDGDPSTYWTTERYFDSPSLGKAGVGLVLDAGKPVTVRRLGIASGTPGFTAVIRAGASSSSFPKTVSGPQDVGSRTTFELNGGPFRYYLIWITKLGAGYNTAQVNEVEAS